MCVCVFKKEGGGQNVNQGICSRPSQCRLTNDHLVCVCVSVCVCVYVFASRCPEQAGPLLWQQQASVVQDTPYGLCVLSSSPVCVYAFVCVCAFMFMLLQYAGPSDGCLPLDLLFFTQYHLLPCFYGARQKFYTA